MLLVANMVQRSVGFGRGVMFCRWLSPDELGAWDMAYSFLLLAAPVVVLGLPGCIRPLLGTLSPARPASDIFAAGHDLDGGADVRGGGDSGGRGAAVFGLDLRPNRPRAQW